MISPQLASQVCRSFQEGEAKHDSVLIEALCHAMSHSDEMKDIICRLVAHIGTDTLKFKPMMALGKAIILVQLGYTMRRAEEESEKLEGLYERS